MNVTESNKLIATFMGWKYCDNDLVFISNTPTIGHTATTFSGWVKEDQPYTKGVPLVVVKENRSKIEYLRKLQYHLSWDWLMPVVDKIEQDLEEEFRVVTYEEECYIWQKTVNQELLVKFLEFVGVCGHSKIDATYKAVVSFILWYNEQKEK